MEWQDIESAPRDGTPLLLFARCVTATASAPIVGWFMPSLGWIEASFTHPVGIVPSHWMSLPPFPRQIADSGNSINAHLAAQALGTEHGNG